MVYRRIDNGFLDPLNFSPESQLGIPGIMDVHRAGTITIANAPGTGIAAVPHKLRTRPGHCIAHPTLALCTVSILSRVALAPRHVDLHPFVPCSPEVTCVVAAALPAPRGLKLVR